MLEYTEFIQLSKKHGLENTLRLFYSVYRGICMDNNDPEKQGRIKIKIAQITGEQTLDVWAWPITIAGNDTGFFAVPAVGDGVWVCFENGSPRFPSYFGGWWAKPKGGESEFPKEAGGEDYPDVSIIKRGGSYLLFNSRKKITRLQNVDGAYIEMSDNVVKLYGENEPAVLGDKNGDIHDGHLDQLLKVVTQLNTVIAAMTTALGSISPPTAATFQTAMVPVLAELTNVSADISQLKVSIGSTKSKKVKLS